MLTIYYNNEGLNIIKNNEIIVFPYFKNNFINLYKNNLIFSTLIKDDKKYNENNVLIKLNDKYNILNLNLDFPYLKSSVFRNFSYYLFPKYYSPTFNYDIKEQENQYYLGVYQTVKSIATGEATPMINFVVFLSDKNTGEIVWYWEMYQYFIDNDLPLEWDKDNNTPIIYSLSRIGKNNLGLDENDVMFTISKINQILFVKPFDGTIDKIINISDIQGTSPSSFVDAHIIPEGLEGEGNLLFFNNNKKSLNPSEIIEYDLVNNKIIFQFGHDKIMNDNLGSSVQKLPNGNYFIYAYNQNRLLEVSSSKEIINEILFKDKNTDKKNNINRFENCLESRQIPEEWASNFIENYSIIESIIKNYK